MGGGVELKRAGSVGEGERRIVVEAARQYIERHGLRALARGVGMRPSGADKVVNGEAQPRGPTLRGFRIWYLRALDAGEVDGAGEESALIGIKLLVQHMPRSRQKAVALRIHQALREQLGGAGGRAPRWVSRLRKLIDIEWP